MKRVLTAVILIPLVVLALFRAPQWLFALLVMGVALLAAREYLDIAEATGFKPFRTHDYVFLVGGFAMLAAALTDEGRGAQQLPLFPMIATLVVLLLLFLSPFILLVSGLRRQPLTQLLPDAAVSFLVLPYIGVSLGCLVVLRASGNGAMVLLYVLLLVWAGDVAALYVGRAVGKHKLAPGVSPGKTWEGTIASVLGAVVVALLLFHWVLPIYRFLIWLHLAPNGYAMTNPEMVASRMVAAPVWLVIAFAVGVNFAAQLGDLVESGLKRGAGWKDSGQLLPGHGGVLDRIDALLFAVPVALLFSVLGSFPRYFTAQGFLIS